MQRHTVIGLIVLLFMAEIGCVRQNISLASGARPNMSPEQVVRVMGGDPIRSEFSDSVMEWHYCTTGVSDQFVAFFFVDNALIETSYYSVPSNIGAFGSCENNIKQGNYREPDRVTEIRVR